MENNKIDVAIVVAALVREALNLRNRGNIVSEKIRSYTHWSERRNEYARSAKSEICKELGEYCGACAREAAHDAICLVLVNDWEIKENDSWNEMMRVAETLWGEEGNAYRRKREEEAKRNSENIPAEWLRTSRKEY